MQLFDWSYKFNKVKSRLFVLHCPFHKTKNWHFECFNSNSKVSNSILCCKRDVLMFFLLSFKDLLGDIMGSKRDLRSYFVKTDNTRKTPTRKIPTRMIPPGQFPAGKPPPKNNPTKDNSHPDNPTQENSHPDDSHPENSYGKFPPGKFPPRKYPPGLLQSIKFRLI